MPQPYAIALPGGGGACAGAKYVCLFFLQSVKPNALCCQMYEDFIGKEQWQREPDDFQNGLVIGDWLKNIKPALWFLYQMLYLRAKF